MSAQRIGGRLPHGPIVINLLSRIIPGVHFADASVVEVSVEQRGVSVIDDKLVMRQRGSMLEERVTIEILASSKIGDRGRKLTRVQVVERRHARLRRALDRWIARSSYAPGAIANLNRRLDRIEQALIDAKTADALDPLP